MLPQKEVVTMVTLRVSASSDPPRRSQRRGLGNASCPIQEQTVLLGPETGLCRGGGCVPRLIPKPGPGGLSYWGLGSEVLPSWRYLAFWLTPPLLQGLRRLGWAEGHPLMDPGRGV